VRSSVGLGESLGRSEFTQVLNDGRRDSENLAIANCYGYGDIRMQHADYVAAKSIDPARGVPV